MEGPLAQRPQPPFGPCALLGGRPRSRARSPNPEKRRRIRPQPLGMLGLEGRPEGRKVQARFDLARSGGQKSSPLSVPPFSYLPCVRREALDQLLFKSASVFTLGTRVVQGRREEGRERSWRLKASVWRKTVARARKRPLGSPLIIPRRSRGWGAGFRSLREPSPSTWPLRGNRYGTISPRV